MKYKIRAVIESIFALCGLILTVFLYRISGRSSGAYFLHKTFYMFGGLPGSTASRFLGKKKLAKLSPIEKVLYGGLSVEKVIKLLNRDGFYVEPKFLDREATSS